MDARDLQTRLAALGFYKGAIDWDPDHPQNFGAASRAALQLALTGDVAALCDGDFQVAAAAIGSTPAHLGAVCDTETVGRGFHPASRLPIILFERHKFAGFTGGKYSAAHPDLSNRDPGGYPADQAGRWDQLFRAVALDADAAFESASWGLFQIMGFNWKSTGASNVWDYVQRAARSEAEQLDLFVAFIMSQPALLKALRAGDWPTFARLYNGPNFAQNSSDQKRKANFARRLAAGASHPA